MSKNITVKGQKSVSKKEIICEKIGFFLFDITKKFNSMSKYCLFKSSAKERIEEAVNERDKREDIGKKVMDYDEEIADVISDPVSKLNEKETEVAVAKHSVFNTEIELEYCEEFIYELYGAWLKNDNERLSELFESRGFEVHNGEAE